MPRMRILKPEFYSDYKILELNFMERQLFQGLWIFSTDKGNMEFSLKSIKAQIFPADDLNLQEIENGLLKMHNLELIILYNDKFKNYLQVVNWEKHQTINRPTPSFIPLYNQELHAHGILTEGSLNTHGGLTLKLSEVKLSKKEEERKATDCQNSSQSKKSSVPEPQKYIDVAKYLQSGIIKKFGQNGKQPLDKDFNNWAKDIRLLVESDNLLYNGKKLDLNTVKLIIDYASKQDNQFIVKSGVSLRKKADNIILNMNKPATSTGFNKTPKIPSSFDKPSGRLLKVGNKTLYPGDPGYDEKLKKIKIKEQNK